MMSKKFTNTEQKTIFRQALWNALLEHLRHWYLKNDGKPFTISSLLLGEELGFITPAGFWENITIERSNFQDVYAITEKNMRDILCKKIEIWRESRLKSKT